jgi:S-adenosylmethionine synthetase
MMFVMTNELHAFGTWFIHKLLQELAILRRENNEIPYLRPDAKSQVTLEYSDDNVQMLL